MKKQLPKQLPTGPSDIVELTKWLCQTCGESWWTLPGWYPLTGMTCAEHPR